MLSLALEDFRGWYMRYRPDWNRLGPQLPGWFRAAVRCVDRRLVLQFIPPRSPDFPRGSTHPHGCWGIYARVPNSDWISRRAVFVLVDNDGEFLPPTHEIVKMLAHARRLRERCNLDALDREYEQQMDALQREKSTESREKMMEAIAATMRKRNMVSYAQPRVFFPAPVTPAVEG